MTSLFPLLPYINLLLAISGLMLLVVTGVLAYDLFANNGSWFGVRLQKLLWLFIIATSVGGVALSLLYSEIFLFVPCSLCWLQRIALYPQALLAIIAYRRGDTIHFPIYGLALSFFGFLVAAYQYVYQMLPAETRTGLMPCLADGSADCADKVIDMFGFVTFPLISAITFAFLIVLYLYLQKTTTFSPHQK